MSDDIKDHLIVMPASWAENSPTLRDRFAMAALTGMIAHGYWRSEAWPEAHQKLASGAYKIADSMLEQRGKK